MTGQIQVALPVDGVWLPASVSRSIPASTQTLSAYRNGLLERSSSGATVEVVDLRGWNRNRYATIGDQYEVRMDVTAGIWGGSITGTWLALNAANPVRQWFCTGTPNSVSGIFSVRRAGSTVTLRTCPVSFTNS